LREYKEGLIVTFRELVQEGTIKATKDVCLYFTPAEIALIADVITNFFEQRGF
jgi:hypothetical protein